MKILRKIIQHWYVLIGLLIFYYILMYRVNLSEVWQTISQANPYFIILSILLTILMSIIQSWRWNYLKKIQGIKYRLRDSYLINSIGFLFSTITPGHIGDLIKIFYLKKDGHPVGKSLVAIVLDRLVDIVFLILIGYLSMYFFVQFLSKYIIILTIAILIIIVLSFFFQKKSILKILVNKTIQFVVPKKYQKSWHLTYQDFIINIKIYRPKNYLIISLITIANWLVFYFSMFFLSKSIDLNEISFIFLAMSITLAILTTLIPISILGLGTRDASLLFFFSFFNVSPEKTISFSTLYLSMLLVTIFIGLFSWFKKPLK